MGPSLDERRRVGIVMNGVTGRMGSNQHLERSIAAIRADGGIPTPGGEWLWPEPLLVGRDPSRVRALAERHGVEWTTSLDSALSDDRYPIYFDAQTTSRRPAAVAAALAAGKHVYCEKPLAGDLGSAIELVKQAKSAGVKVGIVQDKLFLPGLLHLRKLVADAFFGRLLSVRGEFGYWVFEGSDQAPQRPSWNYRVNDGGGIILDMFAHWRYVLEGLFAPVTAVSCLGVTHIPERVDEGGRPYAATADDAAYATFRLEDGIVAQFNSSWATRVYRDDLLTVQVDGTSGSAVAGLRDCWVQPRSETPRAVWNPDVPSPIEYRSSWQRLPDYPAENAFKAQWKLFLEHVCLDRPYQWDFAEGAKGVQLAEAALRSWRSGCWEEIAPLEL